MEKSRTQKRKRTKRKINTTRYLRKIIEREEEVIAPSGKGVEVAVRVERRRKVFGQHLVREMEKIGLRHFGQVKNVLVLVLVQDEVDDLVQDQLPRGSHCVPGMEVSVPGSHFLYRTVN